MLYETMGKQRACQCRRNSKESRPIELLRHVEKPGFHEVSRMPGSRTFCSDLEPFGPSFPQC